MVAWRRVCEAWRYSWKQNVRRGRGSGVSMVTIAPHEYHTIGSWQWQLVNSVVQQWWYGLVEYLWRKMRLLKRFTTALAMLRRIRHGSPK